MNSPLPPPADVNRRDFVKVGSFAAMIAALPDDASMEEIVYRLHVIQRIREGLEDIEAGRTVSHDWPGWRNGATPEVVDRLPSFLPILAIQPTLLP